MMRAILVFLVLGFVLNIGVAENAEAYTTTRSCSFANGAAWNTVSITTYPRNPAYKQRIVRLASKEYYVEPRWGPDKYYRLQYVGLRGTSREWYPRTLPTAFWASASTRSYTFYWKDSMAFFPDSLQDCTVRL